MATFKTGEGVQFEAEQFEHGKTRPFDSDAIYRGTKAVNGAETEIAVDDKDSEYTRLEWPTQPGRMHKLEDGDYVIKQLEFQGENLPPKVLIRIEHADTFEQKVAQNVYLTIADTK